MLVALATTLDHPRACIAAGVLQEHGVRAYVFDEAAAGLYGPVSSGGVRLMVEESDLFSAAAVLNTPAEPLAGEPQGRPALSLASALGYGALNGAGALAVLIPALYFVAGYFVLDYGAVPPGLDQFIPGTFKMAVASLWAGCQLGLMAGLIAWLLSAFRRGHRAGEFFVGIVVIVLLLSLSCVSLC